MFKYLIGRRFDDGQEVYNMIRADSREEAIAKVIATKGGYIFRVLEL